MYTVYEYRKPMIENTLYVAEISKLDDFRKII